MGGAAQKKANTDAAAAVQAPSQLTRRANITYTQVAAEATTPKGTALTACRSAAWQYSGSNRSQLLPLAFPQSNQIMIS